MTGAAAWVAGVDGCAAGWLVVLRPQHDPVRAEARLLATFADVLALPERPDIIAVDIPIGLPARIAGGGRSADRDVRAKLGRRQSAVFAIPARAAVMETDYRAACATAIAHSEPPRMVSKQAFFLFPKIREVDGVMTPVLQDRVVECHPELAFWALNGERALEEPKKVKSRPYEPGLALRRGLLAAAGYDPAWLAAKHFKFSDAGPDDLLDAAANAWSAARIAAGGGRRFPPDPARDARGLRMEIWC